MIVSLSPRIGIYCVKPSHFLPPCTISSETAVWLRAYIAAHHF